MFGKDIKEVVIVKFIMTFIPNQMYCIISLGNIIRRSKKHLYIDSKFGRRVIDRTSLDEKPKQCNFFFRIFKKEIDNEDLKRNFNIEENELCGYEIKEGREILEELITPIEY